jgi:hypothetical protein
VATESLDEQREVQPEGVRRGSSVQYSNYDDSLSNAAAKDPTFDPSLKLSYTFSF